MLNKDKNKRTYVVVAVLVLIVLIGVYVVLRVTGLVSKKPSTVTSEYFDSYISNDSDVISKIEYAFDDKITTKQKKVYVRAMKRQYKKMFYTVLDENVDGKDATARVEVTVFDYNACYNTAMSHINSHSNKFPTEEKQIDYKLSKLETCSDRVTYEINLQYHYDGRKWLMNEINEDDLKKINGVY